MKAPRVVLASALACVLLFAFTSGSFLVINNHQPSDVMVVLAGETDHRPARALELLSQQLAAKILLDVPANAKIYDRTELELAQDYIGHLPLRDSITICPIPGLSTEAEADDVAKCLQAMQVQKVLLVTSDFHTRRALSTFSRKLPQYRFSVAASYDPSQFGPKWWQHRQWAKLNVTEWFRLLWWECVDRWR